MLNTILSNYAWIEKFETIIYPEKETDPNIKAIHPKTSICMMCGIAGCDLPCLDQ
jgi:hypothetical protein